MRKIILFLLTTCTFTLIAGHGASEKKKGTESWAKNHPVKFLENKGQMKTMSGDPAPNVLFKAEAPGLNLYITKTGLTYVFVAFKEDKEQEKKREEHARLQKENIKVKYGRVDVTLQGATIKEENVIKENPLVEHYNYFYPHCPDGIYNVKQYQKITITDVYPGIDWVLYNSNKSGFKYDFIVHPGANPKQIALLYQSGEALHLDDSGALHLKTRLGMLSEEAPVSFAQETGRAMKSTFSILAQTKTASIYNTLVGFSINDKFEKSERTLVIDPQLVWATFYGGNGLEGTMAIKTDKTGNVFACGYLTSTDFPIFNAGTYFQTTIASWSTFILKFANNGALLWATYYGGSGSLDEAYSIATDNTGNIFVCGQTNSSNFPVQNSGTYFQTNAGVADAFILKFDNQGTRLWATCYGGSNYDQGLGVAADNNGNVFLTGATSSTNFPVQNAGTYFQGTLNGVGSGFVVKFNNLGTRLWATYYDKTTCWGIAADQTGNIYITGYTYSLMPTLNPGGGAYYQSASGGAMDVFLLKFTNAGNLVWATYYGGSGSERGNSIAIDNNNNAFVCGVTTSTDLPVQNAGTYFQGSIGSVAGQVEDVFILKFNSAGVRQWATYYGGSLDDNMNSFSALRTDSCGTVYLSFETRSPSLPTVAGCDGGYLQTGIATSTNSSHMDVFLTRFSNNGSRLWATYFGGGGHDHRGPIDIDNKGNLFVSGEWTFANGAAYPLTNPGAPAYIDATFNDGMDDVFFAKFVPGAVPSQSISYGNNAICQGDTSRLPITSPNLVPGGTYSTSTGLSINATTGLVNPVLSAPGTYTVVYTGPTCICAAQATVALISATVVILPKPTLIFQGKSGICYGASVTRTVSGASTYTWSTGASTNIVTLTPSVTTIYTVSATGTNTCRNTTTLQITVQDCAGIEEIHYPGGILKIYPNPSNGTFIVESEDDLKISLENELGQRVRILDLSESNGHKIIITDLAAGIYFVEELGDANSLRPKRDHKIVVGN